MAQAFPQFLLGFCALSIIIGLPAVVIYAVFRWLESVWYGITCFLGLAVFAVVGLILINAFLETPPTMRTSTSWLLLFALPLFGIPWLGGWVHRRTGGASPNWFAATLLLAGFWPAFAIATASLAFGSVFLLEFTSVSFSMRKLPAAYATILGAIFWGMTFFAPVFAPAVVGFMRTFRLRPGLDVPIKEASGEFADQE